GHAALELHASRVGIVTLDTRIVTRHVTESTVVDAVVVLVATAHLTGVEGRRGGKKVDVLKAQAVADLVVPDTGLLDGRVHTVGRPAPLVAGHAARLGTQVGQRDPRRKRHAVELRGRIVVTGDAVDDRAGGRGPIDHPELGSVVAEIVAKPLAAVAARTAAGNLAVVVPVVERRRARVGVRRLLPALVVRR